jgi:RimJ/RimL family protein N-acetyltransferase/anti-anti-sigma regulatory factor
VVPILLRALAPMSNHAHATPDARATTIAVRDELTIRTARRFCEAVDAALAAGVATLRLDVGDVKTVDVVGLAALLQAADRIAARGVESGIVLGSTTHTAALRARILEDLPPMIESAGGDATVIAAELDAAPPVLAASERLVLRHPTWDELALFETWARDPFLEQMVGSDLLYQCRHLGAYHPDYVTAVQADPTAVTALVHPRGAERPVGFVRLYGICLSQQFGFLETAMASVGSVRRAWGIDASRLLLAYAVDTLELQRIEAKAYAYNVLSANSLRRNGFKDEGVLREARTYDGQRWDISVFSILAEEMRAERLRGRFPYMGLWSAAR